MSNWMETYRGVVFPWHCDHFGHMNVRWYGGFFDDAAFQIWTLLGHGMKRMEEAGFHTVIARSTIEYKHEIGPGELFVIETGFVKCGTKSCAHLQRMTNADTGVLHAVQETVEVFFDAATRAAIEIPDEIRLLIEGCKVSHDDLLAPAAGDVS
jgi:acyl-CoA thioester hydrolase